MNAIDLCARSAQRISHSQAVPALNARQALRQALEASEKTKKFFNPFSFFSVTVIQEKLKHVITVVQV
jgi:hypothetical protein